MSSFCLQLTSKVNIAFLSSEWRKKYITYYPSHSLHHCLHHNHLPLSRSQLATLHSPALPLQSAVLHFEENELQSVLPGS